MKGTLFSADFIKDSSGNLRLLELNTDTAVVENQIHNFDLELFVDVLQANQLSQIDIIYKPVIHRGLVEHISNYLIQNAEFITSINLHDEGMFSIYPTQINDDNNNFVLRLAYDESAIFDSEYCKNRLNLYNLFTENSISNYCTAYYHSSSLGEFDTLTREINNSNIPDATIKNINESFNPIQFFKIDNDGLTNEEKWNNFLIQNSGEDKLVEQYHFHSSSVDNNNHITSIRFFGIVYGVDLDIIPLHSYKVSSIFELPSQLDIEPNTNKIKFYHYYELTTNFFKNDASGILSSHEVLMNDGSWKRISDIQVGDAIQSYYLNGSPQNENDLNYLNWNYEGDQFPTGSFITSSNVVFKDVKSLKYGSMLEMIIDNDSLFSGIGKSYLVYNSLTGKTNFRTTAEINALTDYLYDINGNLIQVDDINFYVSTDDNLSFIELDVEETDTYIINGSTAFNAVVSHNSPCFVEGTLVSMGDNSKCKIEDVKVGDKILAFDFKNNETKISQVLNIFSKKVNNIVEYQFKNGGTLLATLDHPLYVVNKGWASYSNSLSNKLYSLEQSVQKIEVGDSVKFHNETDILINMTVLDGEYTVYNLAEIEKYHNYYVNNVLVHNRGGTSCFVAGTTVSMADGSEKNIEDVKLGDIVLSYNEEKLIIEEKAVTNINTPIHDDLIEYILEDDTKIISTFDHPYYINGLELASYKPNLTNVRYDLPKVVKQIQVGDMLNLLNGSTTKIKSIKELDKVDTQTYIISVEHNRNFYANKILVHNK